MTAQELIAKLQQLPPDSRIMILDGFNGGGVPREINLGPVEEVVTQEHGDECGDCEDLVGTTVYVMGYGYY